MAEITIRRTGELLRKLLEILMNQPDGMRAQDALLALQNGVDVLAWNDPLGTKPPRIKVQVKREQSPVNVSVLRSFMALLGDSDVGIFVCTGGFTKDAQEEARTQQRRQVTLVNLERLFELWVEHIENLDEEAKDLFPLKPIYFLSPE